MTKNAPGVTLRRRSIGGLPEIHRLHATSPSWAADGLFRTCEVQNPTQEASYRCSGTLWLSNGGRPVSPRKALLFARSGPPSPYHTLRIFKACRAAKERRLSYWCLRQANSCLPLHWRNNLLPRAAAVIVPGTGADLRVSASLKFTSHTAIRELCRRSARGFRAQTRWGHHKRLCCHAQETIGGVKYVNWAYKTKCAHLSRGWISPDIRLGKWGGGKNSPIVVVFPIARCAL